MAGTKFELSHLVQTEGVLDGDRLDESGAVVTVSSQLYPDSCLM
jgi:hypothetical protein